MILVDQVNREYYVRLPELPGGWSGRQYIKDKMKSAAPNWPHAHIKITSARWSDSLWRVQFNKKSAEYEVMFKMLLG